MPRHTADSHDREIFEFIRRHERVARSLPTGDGALRRRHFLAGALSLAALGIIGTAARRAEAQAANAVRFTAYPFTLGVASGSPRPDGVVLWTRLAPEPLAVAGDGGMGAERVAVRWEVAEDEAFQRIVKKGTNRAIPELAHSVHAEVSGLAPGRWYFYRFMAGDEVSATGRTRTADLQSQRLRFAVASCQQYEQGFFSAYRHMANDNLDLIAFLGDYIYEANWGSKLVRRHAGPECETLAQYRVRHGQYKADADLQAMHARVPWIVTWDDHEVDNDYAGDQSEHLDPRFLLRRAAAYQAYYEHMPLSQSALPRGPDMRLYDRFDFGELATFHVLDNRQYRSPQLCPRAGMGGSAFVENCPNLGDASRTLLGAQQEAWLNEGLAASRSRWNILAQQTLMATYDLKPGPGVKHWTDGWDGYPAARQRLTDFLAQRKIANTLVIGGDVHTHHVAELRQRAEDPRSPIVASEFCGTSITSEGDPQDEIDKRRADNPHLLLTDSRHRGYVVMDLDAKRAKAELRIIDSEKLRVSKVSTLASFVVESGVAGPKPA